LGSFKTGASAGDTTGSSTGTSTGPSTDSTDPTKNPQSPLYGSTANEDGTYTGPDGSIFSSSGIKTWDPTSGYVNYEE